MSDDLYIAVDLGAGSGRVFLCFLGENEFLLEEIHRFNYPPSESDGHLRWDFPAIFAEIKFGLREAGARARPQARSVTPYSKYRSPGTGSSSQCHEQEAHSPPADPPSPSRQVWQRWAPARRLPLGTAMKEGLLGGTLVVPSRSESKEARDHVARWAGFESPQG